MTGYTQGPETTKMSNLITDMTIADATHEEMERAVKHSLVTMDYEKSALDNDIIGLVAKYQGRRNVEIARRLMMSEYHTVKEVAEILGVSEDTVRDMLKDGSS